MSTSTEFGSASAARPWRARRRGRGATESPAPAARAAAIAFGRAGVLVVKMAEGQRVVAGQTLLVIEAMKMVHTVTASGETQL